MKILKFSILYILFSASLYANIDDWTKQTSSAELRGIAFGNGVFVAVDTGGWTEYAGLTYVSSDGVNWQISARDNDKSFTKIVYGGGIFVATGGDTGVSTNGIDWDIQVGQSGNDITYGKNTFVLVDDEGVIATSPDGRIWTEQTSNTTEYLSSIIYGNNEFVAVGRDKTLLKSIDGINWQPVQQQVDSKLVNQAETSDFYNVEYINGRYFSQVGSISLTATSVDNWVEAGFKMESGFQGNAVIHNGEFFVNYLGQRSVDGRLWSLPYFENGNASSDNNVNAIAYGNNTHVIVGDSSKIYTSEDGKKWDKQSGGNTLSINEREDIIYVNNNFFAANSNYIQISSDGIHVNYNVLVSKDNDDIRAIEFSNNRFLVVTEKGSVYTSEDGFIWVNQLTQEDGDELKDVVSGGEVSIAVGSYGSIFVSSNGEDWVSQANDIVGTTNLYSVAYGHAGFVAFGSRIIVTSSDGITWTQQSSDVIPFGYSSAYAHGKYIAVGPTGMHLISTDGITWTNTDTGSEEYQKIVATELGFIAIGNRGIISESIDLGETWNQTDLGSQHFDDVIVVGDKTFVHDGYDIYTRGELHEYNELTSPNKLGIHYRRGGFGAYDMAYGNGRFIAVGGSSYSTSFVSSGPNVRISVNGKQWQDKVSDIPFIGREVVFNNGRFVVPANDDAFYYSVDGLTWSKGESYKPVNEINDFEYLNGLYVAVGRSNLVMTSIDGNKWDVITYTESTTRPIWDEVAFANSTYLVIGEYEQVLISNDGLNWVQRSSVKVLVDNTEEAIDINQVFSVGNMFYGYSSAGLHTSLDGIYWSIEIKLSLYDIEDNETTTNLNSVGSTPIRYENGLFITFSGGYFTTSSNGIDWRQQSGYLHFGLSHTNSHGGHSYRSFHTAFGNGVYTIVSDNGVTMLGNAIGSNWQYVRSMIGAGIRYLNGKIIRGVPGSDTVQISDDLGGTWKYYFDRTPDYDVDLIDFAYHDGIYVAVSDESWVTTDGNKKTIYNSVDAINWVPVTGFNDPRESSAYRLGFEKVIYANNQFVAVGEYGLIATSSDGYNWIQQTSNTVEYLKDIAYGHGGFIAVGSPGAILQSLDGITWQKVEGISSSNNNFNAVGYMSGVYIIAHNYGVLRSTDGFQWTEVWSASNSNYESISTGELGFLVSSSRGFLGSNDLGKTWYWLSDIGDRYATVQVGRYVFTAGGHDNAPDDITTIDQLPTTNDSDGDGVLDANDNCIFTYNPNQDDNDNDNLGDVCDQDDDNDGLPDVWELANGLNPKDPTDAQLDSDNDGLNNTEEMLYNTDPNNIDTDNDGITDGEEVIFGTNPLNKNDFPSNISSWINILLNKNIKE